ncbi:MAG: hypothetical protein GEU81_11500 [Nitriliruptorales bacterium]|nr:hypothetical protein [Nitriliruptorales bacterium]
MLAAQGALDSAADLAGAAAMTAAGSLPFLHAEALVVRADLLSSIGARPDAEQTFEQARLIFRECGAPARVRHVERVRTELGEGRRHLTRARQAPPRICAGSPRQPGNLTEPGGR